MQARIRCCLSGGGHQRLSFSFFTFLNKYKQVVGLSNWDQRCIYYPSSYSWSNWMTARHLITRYSVYIFEEHIITLCVFVCQSMQFTCLDLFISNCGLDTFYLKHHFTEDSTFLLSF